MRLGFGLVSLVLLSACSDNKSNQGYKVKTELLRMAGASYGLDIPGSTTLTATADPERYAWTSAIDIKSLKLPIIGIYLSEFTGDSSTRNPVPLYTCTENCDIDLLGPELTNLLADKVTEIKATGTFGQISVSFGEGTQDWFGKITAEFTLGGKTYYTKKSGPPTTEAPAEESTYTAMGGGSISALPTPIVLSENEGEGASDAKPLTVRLYFDAVYTAFAVDTSKVQPTAHPGGFCVGDMTKGEMTLCTQRLVVSASTAAEAPTFERYLLNDGGLVAVYFEGQAPIGGSLRNYLKEGYPNRGIVNDVDLTVPGTSGTAGRPWASGPVFGFEAQSDGTYLISTVIGEADPSGENGGFRARAFKREDHSGEYETGTGNKYPYTAVKL